MSFRYPAGLITANSPVNANYPSGVWTPQQAYPYIANNVWGDDPYFNQTVLLLHGDGTNGAQNNTFLDSSTNNFTITRNGDTTQGTFSPFSVGAGEWSNFFNGSTDSLSLADSDDWNMGSGDFTAEAWIYPTSFANEAMIMGQWSGATGGTTLNWALMFSSGSTGYLRLITSSDGSSVLFDLSTSTTSFILSLNTWQHVAAVRNGTSFKLYVNGVERASTTNASSLYNATNNFTIGVETTTPVQYFAGQISNARVVKGRAVYTSNFTPSTVPLGATSGGQNPPQGTETKLLTCQSNRFVDNSSSPKTITRNGDVRVTPFSPFQPTQAYSPAVTGGSGYFDGNTDYLSFTDSSNQLDLGGLVASVDMWVYPLAQGTYVIFAKHGGGSNWNTSNGFEYQIQFTGGIFYFYYNNGSGNAGTTAVTDSVVRPPLQWYHVCVATDASNNIGLFINGSRVATGSNAITKPTTRTTMFVGMDINGNALNGYLSSVNFISGSGAYNPAQTTISIPAAPTTVVGNTKLLLNFTNAGILDNTNKNVLETEGNAQIDTSIVKYGTGSMEFDGTGDFLVYNLLSGDDFGNGDFTVELWFYLNATGSQRFISARDNNGGLTLGINSPTQLSAFYAEGSGIINSSASISTGSFNHVALVRSSGTATLYLNGVSQGTSNWSSKTFVSTQYRIGNSLDSRNEALNGYIDDLRITKGIARYTANFIPPIARMPNQ